MGRKIGWMAVALGLVTLFAALWLHALSVIDSERASQMGVAATAITIIIFILLAITSEGPANNEEEVLEEQDNPGSSSRPGDVQPRMG